MTRFSAIRLRIKTREHRFLLTDVTALEALLQVRGVPTEYVPGQPTSEIKTVYFDTPEGTWSTGQSQTKLRARNYHEPSTWWFELKRREDGYVDKWRCPMTPEMVSETLTGDRRWRAARRLIGEQPLIPLFAVQCRRTAYEWPGLRVTLDRDLTYSRMRAAGPLEIGERIGRLDAVVVEVKCQRGVPSWLRPVLDDFDAPNFSKSRYALALLRGAERPFLHAEVAGLSTLSEAVPG